MSRTLGPIQMQYQQQNMYDEGNSNSQQEDVNVMLNDSQMVEQQQSQEQQFYLTNSLPMFLAQSSTPVSTANLLIQKDIQKCKNLIQNLCNNQIKTKQTLQEVSKFIDQTQDLSKGMGYYAAKNMIFLEYIMLLKLYQLYKINGTTLLEGNGLELYKRLAYLKTLLLKLAPVEKKLDYQKNKILKHSQRAEITKQKKQQPNDESDQNQQNQQEDINDSQDIEQQDSQDGNQKKKVQQDQMSFKPRPMSLLKLKQQRDNKKLLNTKYQAPKISSNLSKQQKIKQQYQKQKQRRKLGLIRRLQSDLVDDNNGGAEQKYLGDEINQRLNKKFYQKVNYQEQAFIRLPDNKKDKYYKKQMIRNSMRKNQLEQDYKEVQMVRQLFDQENKAESKFMRKSGNMNNDQGRQRKHMKKESKRPDFNSRQKGQNKRFPNKNKKDFNSHKVNKQGSKNNKNQKFFMKKKFINKNRK